MSCGPSKHVLGLAFHWRSPRGCGIHIRLPCGREPNRVAPNDARMPNQADVDWPGAQLPAPRVGGRPVLATMGPFQRRAPEGNVNVAPLGFGRWAPTGRFH